MHGPRSLRLCLHFPIISALILYTQAIQPIMHIFFALLLLSFHDSLTFLHSTFHDPRLRSLADGLG